MTLRLIVVILLVSGYDAARKLHHQRGPLVPRRLPGLSASALSFEDSARARISGSLDANSGVHTSAASLSNDTSLPSAREQKTFEWRSAFLQINASKVLPQFDKLVDIKNALLHAGIGAQLALVCLTVLLAVILISACCCGTTAHVSGRKSIDDDESSASDCEEYDGPDITDEDFRKFIWLAQRIGHNAKKAPSGMSMSFRGRSLKTLFKKPLQDRYFSIRWSRTKVKWANSTLAWWKTRAACRANASPANSLPLCDVISVQTESDSDGKSKHVLILYTKRSQTHQLLLVFDCEEEAADFQSKLQDLTGTMQSLTKRTSPRAPPARASIG